MAFELAALMFVALFGGAAYLILRYLGPGAWRRQLLERLSGPHGVAGPHGGAAPKARRPASRLRSGSMRLRWLYRFDLTRRLEENLWQAGIYTPATDVLLLMLLMLGAGVAIGGAIWRDSEMAIAVGGGFAALPIVYIRDRRRRRLKAFRRQLPLALDLIKSALEAGHSLSRGLEVVVQEFQDPIATEFRSVIEQSRLGLPLARGMEEMLGRVPVEDLRLLVVAVRVQSEVGSSLAQIIGRLSEIVRTRQRLQAQIHALTAQSRLSGWIVGLLPILVLAVLSVVQPDYTRIFFHDPAGLMILKAMLTMDLLALVIIRQLLKVKF